MKNDVLGARIKEFYEDRYRIKLTRKIPVILRLDGKSFHTLTRNCQKPFDLILQRAMSAATFALIKEVQGVKCAYTSSDKIYLLLTDFDKLTTEAWFDYNLQKICSITAAIASVEFTNFYRTRGIFDCRAFNVPKEEVINIFHWRQLDWVKNSVSMLAQANFSHTELQGKSQKEMHDMLHEKEINWANLDPVWKNGAFFIKNNNGVWIEDHNTIFIQNRDIINSLIMSV